MATLTTSATHDAIDDRLSTAARHLYDAECAVHVAHQTHVDAWIAAASDRLDEALNQYFSALAGYEHWKAAADE
jgi:hypothetical protein